MAGALWVDSYYEVLQKIPKCKLVEGNPSSTEIILGVGKNFIGV